jgi:DNA polymerase-3 subunit gamma/tau
MSSFVVSARKYRPLTFDSVVGQKHVTDTLKNAIKSNHLAQAFLFCGPRGVGKTTTARILAKVLNCESPTADTEPCGTCNSCEAFQKNASLNVHELDAASNNSVDHIRALIEQVRFAPQAGSRYKIYIIDEVHMLSQQAFNAFLKTLEEPPPYAIFILATTEKHKIIPTILSRCQIFDFKRIMVQDMVEHLQRICQEENVNADEDALSIIAQKADGALRDALSIYDRVISFAGNEVRYADVIENLNILDYDYYFKVTEAIAAEDIPGMLLQFDDVLARGFDPDLFVNGLAEHFRNLLVCQDHETLRLLEVAGNIRERYRMQAALMPTSLLLSALAIANDCDVNFKMARNKRLHVEMALIRMCHIRRGMNILKQGFSEAAVEKKTPDLNVGPQETPSTSQKIAPPVKNPLVEDAKALREQSTSIKSLTKLHDEVKQEATQNNIDDGFVPSLEVLQAAWNAFVLTIESPSVKSALGTVLLSLNGDVVGVKVRSEFVKSNILGEANLMGHLKQALRNKNLVLDIQIDESLKAQQDEDIKSEKPKALTAKDIYQHFKDTNPLVEDLRLRFDLTVDR